MRKEKFTPGPWCVTNATDVFSGLGAPRADGIKAMHNDGWHIADCGMGYTLTRDGEETLPASEAMANARLIAAAPELYEALQDMLSGWRYIRAAHGDLYGVGWDRAESAASAALAKARGES